MFKETQIFVMLLLYVKTMKWGHIGTLYHGGSRIFQEILQKARHAHPVLYLQDVSSHYLKYLLEFLYTGEVNVTKIRLDRYWERTKELNIMGTLDQGGIKASFKLLSDSNKMVEIKGNKIESKITHDTWDLTSDTWQLIKISKKKQIDLFWYYCYYLHTSRIQCLLQAGLLEGEV